MSSCSTKKEANGSWTVKLKWKDYSGKQHETTRRGFSRQKDALTAGKEFLEKHTGSSDMLFSSLVDIYLEDKKVNLKEVSWYDKKSRLETWVLPYFKDVPVNRITPAAVREWQNTLKTSYNSKETLLSPGYIQNIVAEMSGVFNFGTKYYGITGNPIKITGNSGKKQKSITFWTKEEFDRFISTFDQSDKYYAGFITLYYSGLRKGELLALTPEDLDLEKGLIDVNKTYKVLEGKPVITSPKTEKSNRAVTIPPFLCSIIKSHMGRMYGLKKDERVFPYSDTRLAYELNKHTEGTGLKKIRIHDLRHSHASLLIDMGFSITLISERLGHEDVSTTLNVYGHLFPSKQSEVAEKLEEIYKK